MLHFSSGEYLFSCFQDTGNGFIWTDEELKAQGHLAFHAGQVCLLDSFALEQPYLHNAVELISRVQN